LFPWSNFFKGDAEHSEKYPKSPLPPVKNEFAEALRYTFALTDVAVKLLLGTKYQPVLFFVIDFKIKFQSPKHLFFIIKAFQMF
jgi:hypothetical protein